MWSATSVQYGETFALIGGNFASNWTNAVQLFDPETMTFTLLDETLSEPRRAVAAMLVDESKPECS